MADFGVTKPFSSAPPETLHRRTAFYVWAVNRLRRHMDHAQLATLAVEALPLLEAEAKERQKKLAGTRQSSNTDLSANLREGQRGRAADVAAAMVGVSSRTVQDAKFVQEHNPEEFAKLKAGQTTVHAAKQATKAAMPGNDGPAAAACAWPSRGRLTPCPGSDTRPAPWPRRGATRRLSRTAETATP